MSAKKEKDAFLNYAALIRKTKSSSLEVSPLGGMKKTVNEIRTSSSFKEVARQLKKSKLGKITKR